MLFLHVCIRNLSIRPTAHLQNLLRCLDQTWTVSLGVWGGLNTSVKGDDGTDIQVVLDVWTELGKKTTHREVHQ